MRFGRENINRSPDITGGGGHHIDNRRDTPVSPGGFRCPFEIKGDKEGTIVEARFDDDKANRLKLIKASLDYFYKNPTSVAMRFHLPHSLLKSVKSLEELKVAIIPYQAEILASELDYRLDPFMPYQMKQYKDKREEIKELFMKTPYKFATTNLITKIVKEHGFPLEKIEDLANWINVIMTQGMAEVINNPHLVLQDLDEHGELVRYLTITPGSVLIHPEDYESVTGPGKDRRNCFGIVLNPFYPKEFGRYSEDIQIVMASMKDIASVGTETRRKIREQSNRVYEAHGVKIEDIREDKQHEGVWIPEWKKDS